MNKKQLIVFCLLIASNAYALPYKFNWNLIPVKKDIKHYENKEYGSYKEYIDALEAGKCSSMWVWVHLDKQQKTDSINDLKQRFRKINVVISKPTEFYVSTIDDMIQSEPESQHFKVGVVFKTIAIIEYDFDEGIDKDETAKKWLGDYYKTFKEYRSRNEE